MNPTNPNSLAITVAAIDDEAIVRLMIERLISHSKSVSFLGAFMDIDQAVSNLGSSAPDVILLDWNLAGSRIAGTAGVQALKEAYPRSRILIFSGVNDEDTAIKALTVGADGYLLKNTPAAQLTDAITAVAVGENPMSPSITSKLVRFLRSFTATIPPEHQRSSLTSLPPLISGLTIRERTVMDLICKGEPTKRIADHMGVTIHTIRFHLRNIYEKLGAHSQTEAVLNYLKIT